VTLAWPSSHWDSITTPCSVVDLLPSRPCPCRAGDVWIVGFRHLGWDMSHQGMVLEVSVAWALSGLKANERLPCSEVGPRCWPEPDLRTDLACGAPWSMHFEATDMWAAHHGSCRTWILAHAGLGHRLSLVLRVLQSCGTETIIVL
jgi:hypothetical protein